jgi:hypothetical protein
MAPPELLSVPETKCVYSKILIKKTGVSKTIEIHPDKNSFYAA